MVQPKYSPEEALERVKLMMKYDLSKTSTENKKVVSEQRTTLTADDLNEGGKFVKLGMKGDIVGKIQELLVSKGYKDISKDGTVDNSFGERTKKMVEKFQSTNGLKVDGVVGKDTWWRLNHRSAIYSDTKTSLSCVKKFYQVHDSLVPTQDIGNSFRAHVDPFERLTPGQDVLVWDFKIENGVGEWSSIKNGRISERGTFFCIDDQHFRMSKENGNNYYTSKRRDGSPAITSLQKIDNPSYKLIGPPPKPLGEPGGELRRRQALQQQTQTVQTVTEPKQTGPAAEPSQTGPATEPVQTGPAAGYTDANQQSTLKRQDSILSDILDNQSVNKSVCRKNIKDFYTSFQQKNSIVVDPATIAQAKRIVQACKDQHYGKFGILGRGGQNIDNMLNILSGRKEGGPLTQGPDSIWRIK